MSKNQLFIVWAPFQRRAVSIQPYFGYTLKFIRISFSQRFLRPLEYAIKTGQTLYWLIKTQPDIVWVQLPPTFLLHILFAYKILLNRTFIILADCHNATFRKPWINIPGFKSWLRRCDLVIVHNKTIKQQAVDQGVDTGKTFVLEDPPAQLTLNSADASCKNYTEPWILCPCSFNQDEPISTILEAAQLTPEITFVLTGNKQRALGHHDLTNLPSNLYLPGFLPNQEFDQLLQSATIVMGLTLLDGIQLSVANEAVGVGKGLVLADTTTLRSLFYKGAVYVKPSSAASIATGCTDAIKRRSELEQDILSLRDERQTLWTHQAEQINSLLQTNAKNVG